MCPGRTVAVVDRLPELLGYFGNENQEEILTKFTEKIKEATGVYGVLYFKNDVEL